ncbi:MAG: hypothetical protein AMXMBFR52_23450 [Burkholderiales bacterium]
MSFTSAVAAMIHRRQFLQLALGALPLGVRAHADPATATRVAGGWRLHERDYQVGTLRVRWTQGQAEIESAVAVPGRPHAVVPEPGGGFLAVAARPGQWLLRMDARGTVANRLAMADEGDQRTLDGHVIASRDGQWLFTGETDRQSGDGWVSVRDTRDLRKVAQFRTHGIDPHQILVADDDRLIVANGGIPRGPGGGKRDLHRMNPSLVRMDPANGELLGKWTLPDRRLSPHHIAWNEPTGSVPRLLGIGLQAEHDHPAERRAAPLLAVWDGQKLTAPRLPEAQGYAGDVAAGPDGGFVLTAQYAGRIVMWVPGRASELTTIGDVQNPCGLWPLDRSPGVIVGAGLGLARWHPSEPARMLRWPAGVSADNHWALLTDRA